MYWLQCYNKFCLFLEKLTVIYLLGKALGSIICTYMIPVGVNYVNYIVFCCISRLDAFYWHEIDQEIRERKMDWVFKGTIAEIKDSFMDHINVL